MPVTRESASTQPGAGIYLHGVVERRIQLHGGVGWARRMGS